jgi:opacity protein-like surface antigen
VTRRVCGVSPLYGKREKVLLRMKLLVILAATMMVAMSVASPAFAHHCANVSKKSGAGSIGTINADTGEETFTKANGGFLSVTGTLEDGSTFSYDIFAHGTRPDGAMAAGPAGDSECDGVGIDDALACLGIPE